MSVGLMKPLRINAHKNNNAKPPIAIDIRYLPCNCGSKKKRSSNVATIYKITKIFEKVGFIYGFNDVYKTNSLTNFMSALDLKELKHIECSVTSGEQPHICEFVTTSQLIYETWIDCNKDK